MVNLLLILIHLLIIYMAKQLKESTKVSFGTRKRGVFKKKRNKNESVKPYNRQGR